MRSSPAIAVSVAQRDVAAGIDAVVRRREDAEWLEGARAGEERLLLGHAELVAQTADDELVDRHRGVARAVGVDLGQAIDGPDELVRDLEELGERVRPGTSRFPKDIVVSSEPIASSVVQSASAGSATEASGHRGTRRWGRGTSWRDSG